MVTHRGQIDGVEYLIMKEGDIMGVSVPLSFECLIWRLRLGRGSMLCAPILHSLGGDSFIRANNAIDGMAFK
jgi:hypothetical protein